MLDDEIDGYCRLIHGVPLADLTAGLLAAMAVSSTPHLVVTP